jgi:thiol-disulfide isomerase/thioredoxin
MNIKNTIARGFAMPLALILMAIALIGGGIVYLASRSQVDHANMGHDSAPMTEKEDSQMKKEGDLMMIDQDTGENIMKHSGTILAGAGTPSPLFDFNKPLYEEVVASDKLLVLYFYANWCPICKTETVEALYPAFNELKNDKVIGIRINFNDNETDTDEKNIGKQFGVIYQHTKVFVKNGKKVFASPQGWDKNRYLTEINKWLGQ